jgi:hypothetical protein
LGSLGYGGIRFFFKEGLKLVSIMKRSEDLEKE